MKRSNTQAKNVAVNTRLKGLALITGMVLLFSSGISIAAPTDFKLWHKPVGSEKLVELTHISDDDSAKSVKWLATEPSAENTIKFVTAFAAEPFKFAEGVKAALKSVKTDEEKTKLKADIKKSMEEVNELVFGSSRRKLALKDLMTKILEAKDLDKEDLLKELFDEISREELGLKTKGEEEVVKTEPTKTPSPEPTKSTDAGAGKTIEELMAQIKKEWDEIRKGLTEKPNTSPSPEPTRPPVEQIGQNPNTPVNPNPVNPNVTVATGERNNGQLEKLVNQVCDQVGALQTAAQAQFAALNKNAADAIDGLNNLFNQEAIRQRFNGQQQKKNNIEDALPGLIAQALGDNGKNNQGITPPQPIQPPQQLAQRNNRDEQQPLPLPSPEPQQPQQPQVAPMMSLPVLADNSPIRVATGRLPISDGLQELDRAESLAASLENREPVTKQLSMIPQNQLTSAMLISPISKLDGEINRIASTKRVADEKAKTLDRQLERLKEGGRAALSDADKRREKQYAAEFEEKKQSFEQEKQMIQQQAQQIAQSGGDAASYSQQANQYLTQKMQEVQQAKRRKEQFDAELESKVESLNGEIKSLANQRDDLKSVSADLGGKLGTLKSEQAQLSQMYTTTLNREMSAINGPQQPTGNPVGQRIIGFGGRSTGAPRTAPSRVTPQSGLPVRGAANTGDAMRGSLSSKSAQ